MLDLINTYNKSIDYARLNSIFNLDVPLNRTLNDEMNLQSIEKEYSDWKYISQYFKQIKK